MNLRNWRNFEKIEQWDNPMKLILPENLLKLILLSNNSLTVLFLDSQPIWQSLFVMT